jgi:pyrroloquinoline quinone biosynthesis protein D
MSSSDNPQRLIITRQSRPMLRPHVKMRQDAARNRWVLLAPERVYTPDDIALAILKLCDGTRTVEAIASTLAEAYSAPAAEILTDVVVMLQGLADKGLVQA